MANLFVTAINCMDGRVQEPIISYMKGRFGADYVDMITEPGPVAIIADPSGDARVPGIRARAEISVNKHGSAVVAVVGHDDCAGNPAPPTVQQRQVRASVEAVKQWHPEVNVIGLWVDDNWDVSELER